MLSEQFPWISSSNFYKFYSFSEQLPGCFQSFVTISNVKYNGGARIPNFYRIISMLFPCFQNNFHRFLKGISIHFTAFREQLPGCFQSFITISNVKYNGRARISKEFPDCFHVFGTISMLFLLIRNNLHVVSTLSSNS